MPAGQEDILKIYIYIYIILLLFILYIYCPGVLLFCDLGSVLNNNTFNCGSI